MQVFCRICGGWDELAVLDELVMHQAVASNGLHRFYVCPPCADAEVVE